MIPHRSHWGDALRAHFVSWGCGPAKQMADLAQTSEANISDWLKRDTCPNLHNTSIIGLTRALDVSPSELRDLPNYAPRGPHKSTHDAPAGTTAPFSWSQVSGKDVPAKLIIAALKSRGVSVHLISEINRQIQAPPRSQERETDSPGTRTTTSSHQGSRAS